MSKPMLELQQLCKHYHDGDHKIQAVDHIDLQINKGEFISLYGPSGSGKTTLLNLIGGLERPNSGRILLNDLDVAQLSANALTDLRLHKIGFIFQSYNLIPVLSALENVAFIMQMQGQDPELTRQRAMDVLSEVGLAGLEHRRPSELSGGQQQRVAVARAIAAKPSLVLADEPTANLDSLNSQTLMELLKKLNEELEMTFIITSHDPEVINFAPRRIQLRDGKMVADDRN